MQVVHDGAPVELRQGRHVIHALLIHGVHGRHLLVCNCALLISEYLMGEKQFNCLVTSSECFSQLPISVQFRQKDPESASKKQTAGELFHFLHATCLFSKAAIILTILLLDVPKRHQFRYQPSSGSHRNYKFTVHFSPTDVQQEQLRRWLTQLSESNLISPESILQGPYDITSTLPNISVTAVHCIVYMLVQRLECTFTGKSKKYPWTQSLRLEAKQILSGLKSSRMCLLDSLSSLKFQTPVVSGHTGCSVYRRQL